MSDTTDLGLTPEDIPAILMKFLLTFNPCLDTILSGIMEADDKTRATEEKIKDFVDYQNALFQASRALTPLEIQEQVEEDWVPEEGSPTYQHRKQKVREGQALFKSMLIKALGQSDWRCGDKKILWTGPKKPDGNCQQFIQCMFTGVFYPSFIVDAAHIHPHRDESHNNPQNGLLLRKDLHGLFDANLIGVEPKSLKIQVNSLLQKKEVLGEDAAFFKKLHGKTLVLRTDPPAGHISRKVLDQRYEEYTATLEATGLTGLTRRRNPESCLSDECRHLQIERCEVSDKTGYYLGLDIRTANNRYQLLIGEIYGHRYEHTTLVKMNPRKDWPDRGYRYILGVEALENFDYRAIYIAFRLLFMGDGCINPFLNKKITLLTQPQKEGLDACINSYAKGERAGILCLPTGMGKTICATAFYKEMCAIAGRPLRALFLSMQKEHLISAESKFVKYCGFLRGNTSLVFTAAPRKVGGEEDGSGEREFKKPEDALAVFSTHLSCTDAVLSETFDLVVIDECHHASAPTYQNILLNIFSSVDRQPSYLLGLTATPFRNDTSRVIELFGTEGYKQGSGNIVYSYAPPGYDVASCIEEGYLSQVIYTQVSDVGNNINPSDLLREKDGNLELDSETWDEALEKYADFKTKIATFLQEYQKLCDHFLLKNPQTLIFCPRSATNNEELKFAEIAAQEINRHFGACVCLPYIDKKRSDSKFCHDFNGLDDYKIIKILNTETKKTTLNMLTVVDRVNEGVDLPQVEVLVFLTYTGSRVRQIQQLGRGLRLAPNKRCTHVLDFESNYPDLYYYLNASLLKPVRAPTIKADSEHNRVGIFGKPPLTLEAISKLYWSNPNQPKFDPNYKSNIRTLIEKNRGAIVFRCGPEPENVISLENIEVAQDLRRQGHSTSEICRRLWPRKSLDGNPVSQATKEQQELIRWTYYDIQLLTPQARKRYISEQVINFMQIIKQISDLNCKQPLRRTGKKEPLLDWQEFCLMIQQSRVPNSTDVLPRKPDGNVWFATSLLELMTTTASDEKNIIKMIDAVDWSKIIVSIGFDATQEALDYYKNVFIDSINKADHYLPFKKYYLAKDSRGENQLEEDARKGIERLLRLRVRPTKKRNQPKPKHL